MLRKVIVSFIPLILIFSLIIPSAITASTNTVKIFIDGKEISTDQPPVIQNNRTLVPMRAIFEGLQATVNYDAKTKKITAKRSDTTIVLTLGSKTATINNKSVQLEVPAQALNNRTLVPLRFVGEALGDEVHYNQATKRVEIVTKNNKVSNLTAKDIGNYGDGRDLQISFERAADESKIDHYRAIIVKKSKLSTFKVEDSLSLSTNRYVTIPKQGRTIQRTFSSNTRDMHGDYIQNDFDYTVIVVSVTSNRRNMSYESIDVTLSNLWKVDAVTSLRVADVSDYGDSRDIEISFNKIANENHLIQYQAIVVRADEADSFTLSAAKELTSNNYQVIPKRGANIQQILHSSTRDSKGRKIQNDIAYKVFIVSVGNQGNSYSSSLSAASAAFTLKSNPQEIRVSKLAVKDIYDYGDGRDIEVSFTAPNNVTRVNEYRIFVVREENVKSFTLEIAEKLSSAYYTSVPNNNYKEVTRTLNSSVRDVNGYYIQSNVNYKVFVLSIGLQANDYKNSLSTASPTIKLTNNQLATAVTGLTVKDISDWGDGRDVEVSFNKVSDETKISEYRIMVVKAAQAKAFNLQAANSTSHYTYVAKTGSNLTKILTATSKDVYGEVIREGVDYNVFVLSITSGGNSGNNALSAASPILTLKQNANTPIVSGVTVTDIGNNGNASDLEVKFNKVADEGRISEYRIMVVKSGDEGSFNLTNANLVPAARYMRVTKTGENIAVRLPANSLDVNGNVLSIGQDYYVFVLAVANTGNSNSLSAVSNVVKISNPQVQPATNVTVTDVANNGDGRDLQFSFIEASPNDNISYYDVLVVKTSYFTLDDANRVLKENRTKVKVDAASNPITTDILAAGAKDTDGDPITTGVSYRVFILSIAEGSIASKNALSAGSGAITLTNSTP